MVKNKDFDLRIYLSYESELRITAGKTSDYTVIDSNNPAVWISRAKEIINNFRPNIRKSV